MRPRFAVLAVLAFVWALPGAAAPTREWAVDPVTTGLLVEDHRVPLVTVSLEFPVGTWSPWAVEHDAETAFVMQDRDPDGALRRRADLLAADLRLEMQSRSASLRISCRKEDLPEVLRLAKEVLANASFDRAELRRRKQTAKLAWKASLKEPRFALAQAAARILFAEGDPRRDPYERPRNGETDSRKLAAARDLVIRVPGRVIGFAGDLDEDRARTLSRGLLPPPLDSAPDGIEPLLRPVTPPDSRPRVVSVDLPRLTQVYFAYGRESLGYRDPDYPASTLVDHALGGHFNSRLMVALRQEGGDTYGAGVFDDGDLDPGLYGLTTFTRTDNAATVETKLRGVLAKLHDEGISEEERALAAGNGLGRRAFRRQSPDQILDTAMEEHRLGLPYGFFDDVAQRAAALPLGEINAFVGKFYDPAKFTLLRVRAKD